MTWATLTADGQFEVHAGIPTLEQMQRAVRGPRQERGLVEVVEIKHEITMWANEEAKYECPDRNWRATHVAHLARAISTADYISGDVVFTGGPDDEGETMGLTPEQLTYVQQLERMTEIGYPGSGVWNMTGLEL